MLGQPLPPALPDLSHLDPATREKLVRAQVFAAARSSVVQCRACPLGQRMPCGPVPAEGSAMPLLAVVTGWIGPLDAQAGRPMAGAERELFADSLARLSGLSLDKAVLVPAIGCRAESAEEYEIGLQACSGNLRRQLETVNPDAVLLVGAGALRAFKPKLDFQECRGGGWLEPGINSYRAFFVVDDPTQVRTPKQKAQFEADMRFLGRVLQWKFVERAARVFQSDMTWPSLIDGTIEGLNPFDQAQHKARFVGRVIEETVTKSPAAAWTAQEQQIEALFDGPDAFSRTMTQEQMTDFFRTYGETR